MTWLLNIYPMNVLFWFSKVLGRKKFEKSFLCKQIIAALKQSQGLGRATGQSQHITSLGGTRYKVCNHVAL